MNKIPIKPLFKGGWRRAGEGRFGPKWFRLLPLHPLSPPPTRVLLSSVTLRNVCHCLRNSKTQELPCDPPALQCVALSSRGLMCHGAEGSARRAGCLLSLAGPRLTSSDHAHCTGSAGADDFHLSPDLSVTAAGSAAPEVLHTHTRRDSGSVGHGAGSPRTSRWPVLTGPLSPVAPSSCFAVAASTPNSTAGAAMNSLTSLGTLQGLAGATVGLNNINALAGTVHSEYSLLWWTAFPQILRRRWSAGNDLTGVPNWEN